MQFSSIQYDNTAFASLSMHAKITYAHILESCLCALLYAVILFLRLCRASICVNIVTTQVADALLSLFKENSHAVSKRMSKPIQQGRQCCQSLAQG